MANEERQKRKSLRQKQRTERKELRAQQRDQRKAQREERCQMFWQKLLGKHFPASLRKEDSPKTPIIKEEPRSASFVAKMFPQKGNKSDNRIFGVPHKDIKFIIGGNNYNKVEDEEGIVKEGKPCYLVYVDKTYHLRGLLINAQAEYHSDAVKEQQKEINKIKYSEAFLTANLSRLQKKEFTKVLGQAYVSIMEGCYDEVDNVINKAREYAISRNKEMTRMISLLTGTVIALIAFAAMCYFSLEGALGTTKIAMLMGVIGSYVSLWTRFKNLGFLSMGGRISIISDAICRMFIGTIFAYVAVLALRCGLLIALPTSGDIYAIMGIVGFAAGFSERFIPSLVKKFVQEESGKEEKNGE